MDRAAGRALLACALLVPVALAGPLAGPAGARSGTGPVPQTDGVDPDGVVLRADVATNGSAAWSVEYRIRLDDPNVTEAFEGLRRDVRANRSAYADRFGTRMSRTVAAAENATGREMRLANVSVTAETRQLPQSYGVVRYRFEWVGFARVDGDRLVVGDALAGLFLDAESRLILAWPVGYEAASVAPEGYEEREGAVVWTGPIDFGPDQPRVTLRPAGGLPLGAIAVGVLVLFGTGAAVVTYRRRTAADDGGAAAAGGTGDDDGDGEDDAADVPEELLSPGERVLRFVRDRGGRVKQGTVVDEFDWTAARTSQVVGDLRDDGEIETFRIGRENVLTLPGTGVVGDDGGGDGDDGDGGGDGDDGDGDGDGGDGGSDGDGDDGNEGVDWRP